MNDEQKTKTQLIAELQQLRQQVTELSATAFDITARQNVEQRDKLAYELGQQLTSLLDLDVLLRKTVYHLQETFGYYHVQVYLFEPTSALADQKIALKGDLLVLREGTGPAAWELKRHQHSIPLEAKRSLVARAARLRMPVVANDVSRNPSHLPNPLLPETRAEVAIPLVVEQRLLGVLDVQHSIVDYFNVDKIRILQIIANQLSIALTNAQLFEENERRLAIIENSAELIALINLEDGRIIYVNPVGIRLTGYNSPEEIIGQKAAEFFTPEDRAHIKKEILPIVFEQGVWRGESRLRRSDGTLMPVAQIIFVIPEKHGQPQTIAAIISDITEQKRAEAERSAMQAMMFQSGKLASVGELAAGVAHEINNPIYAIREFADLILEDMPQDDPNCNRLQTIVNCADRITDIVRNLLAFARPDEAHFNPTHIGDVWQLTYNLIGQSFLKYNIQLEVDIPSDLPKMKVRTQQLQQVLLNLVTNARDALNEKYPGYHPNKRISIRARLVEDPTFPFFLNKDQDEKRQVIRLTVRDEGVGITPEQRERLFTPFFTTKRPNRGTGLGLSISHKIIEDHHGRIEVESEPGAFTEVTIILPVDNGGVPITGRANS